MKLEGTTKGSFGIYPNCGWLNSWCSLTVHWLFWRWHHIFLHFCSTISCSEHCFLQFSLCLVLFSLLCKLPWLLSFDAALISSVSTFSDELLLLLISPVSQLTNLFTSLYLWTMMIFPRHSAIVSHTRSLITLRKNTFRYNIDRMQQPKTFMGSTRSFGTIYDDMLEALFLHLV